MKIRPVGAELFHADGQTDRQTDMTNLIVALHNFANAPKHLTQLPSKHCPSAHTHLLQRPCPCWMRLCKSTFGTAASFYVVFCWTSSDDTTPWRFAPNPPSSEGLELHGVRSGEYGGRGMVWFGSSPKPNALPSRYDKLHFAHTRHTDKSSSTMTWKDPYEILTSFSVCSTVTHWSDITIVRALTFSSFLDVSGLQPHSSYSSDSVVPVVRSKYLRRFISIHCTETYIVSAANVPSLYNLLFDRCSHLSLATHTPQPATHHHALSTPLKSTTPFSYLCAAEFRKLLILTSSV
jgi:hypothetical protein